MKTVEATLLEDFGPVDRNLVRSGLLAERGINAVLDGPGDHSFTIEYDPAALGGEKLLEILCRNGVCPQVVAPPPDRGRAAPTSVRSVTEALRATARPAR